MKRIVKAVSGFLIGDNPEYLPVIFALFLIGWALKFSTPISVVCVVAGVALVASFSVLQEIKKS